MPEKNVFMSRANEVYPLSNLHQVMTISLLRWRKALLRWRKALPGALLLALFGSGCQSPEAADTALWPETTNVAKPWTRWWWMGNAVDTANLSWQLEELAKAGIGGVEVSPIYGVKGYEAQFLDHLSPAWLAMLDHAIRKAGEWHMQVDMIQGTGWPFGGPQIGPALAASRLFVQRYALQAGGRLSNPILIDEVKQRDLAQLEALLAFDETGAMTELTGRVNEQGYLDWQAPPGEWTLYAVFCGKTRQQVKRPSPGGAGWVLDHFSRAGLDRYLEPYDTALSKLQYPIRALFNDSYEVGGADWTPGLLDKFAEKRGYDLRPWLPQLLSGEKNDTTARLLSDYRETLSDLLLEDFTQPWGAWARERGFLIRNQAHGSPGNLLDLYAAADIPECESFSSTPFAIPGLRRDTTKTQWEDPDPVMLKFASSAAHVAGRPLTSAESMTWLGDHFQVALSQCKPEMEQLFLSGVNHVFFHGTPYSPREAPWPGWKFYASTHFSPHNTIWRDAPAFFSYIERVQSVLQAGEPDNELLVYWPAYDVWQDTGHGSLLQQLSIHHISEWLLPTPFYRLVVDLTAAGYLVDFISDRQLAELTAGPDGIQAPGGLYRALLLPGCDRLPVSSFQQLLDLAKDGGRILMTDLPEDPPGWQDLDRRRAQLERLTSVLDLQRQEGERLIEWGRGIVGIDRDIAGLLGQLDIRPEKMTAAGLKFIRRKVADGHYYYIVNHTAEPVREWIPLAVDLRSAVLMDPQSGRTGLADMEKGKDSPAVRLQLLPGEAMIVRTFAGREFKAGPPWIYEEEAEAIVLNGPWEVEFLEGGPEPPAGRRIDRLTSWTEWDESARNFSGTARYQTTFAKPAAAAAYILDLGLVRESARVMLNGREAGAAWSIPYRLRIDADQLQEENQLAIEVTNLGANRIRYMDRQGVEWKKFYDINVVHKSYQPFDASDWPDAPSGLLGPVRLIPAGAEGK